MKELVESGFRGLLVLCSFSPVHFMSGSYEDTGHCNYLNPSNITPRYTDLAEVEAVHALLERKKKSNLANQKILPTSLQPTSHM